MRNPFSALAYCDVMLCPEQRLRNRKRLIRVGCGLVIVAIVVAASVGYAYRAYKVLLLGTPVATQTLGTVMALQCEIGRLYAPLERPEVRVLDPIVEEYPDCFVTKAKAADCGPAIRGELSLEEYMQALESLDDALGDVRMNLERMEAMAKLFPEASFVRESVVSFSDLKPYTSWTGFFELAVSADGEPGLSADDVPHSRSSGSGYAELDNVFDRDRYLIMGWFYFEGATKNAPSFAVVISMALEDSFLPWLASDHEIQKGLMSSPYYRYAKEIGCFSEPIVFVDSNDPDGGVDGDG